MLPDLTKDNAENNIKSHSTANKIVRLQKKIAENKMEDI